MALISPHYDIKMVEDVAYTAIGVLLNNERRELYKPRKSP